MDLEETEREKSLDAQIAKITKSTRTNVSAILPLHDILRVKYSYKEVEIDICML